MSLGVKSESIAPEADALTTLPFELLSHYLTLFRYEKNHQELNAENIHLVSIGSRVKMHDENIEACKIEL